VILTEDEVNDNPVLADVIEAKKRGECGFPIIISEEEIENDPTMTRAVEEVGRERGEWDSIRYMPQQGG
jgi:hypothetical protein